MTDQERQAAIEALQARRAARGDSDPLARLQHHVTGAVERCEAAPIAEVTAYRQGATLKAKAPFSFKAPGSRGRAVTVKPGQLFWVTNSGLDQNRSGLVMIDRIGRGCISNGYAFNPDTLQQYFERVES